jgi:hypothetical protein
MNEATSRAIEVVAIAAKVKHTESRDAMGHYSDLKRLEADGETYQTGFEDGATWVLDKQLLFSPAGVWRRASEVAGSIQEYKPVYARLIKDEIVSSGFFTRGSEIFICHCDDYPIDSTRFGELEIFCEQPSPAPVEALREALEKIAESNKHDSELHRRGYKDKCLVCIATEALKQHSPSKEKEV